MSVKNAFKGQNACKGQGFKAIGKARYDAAGGKFTALKCLQHS